MEVRKGVESPGTGVTAVNYHVGALQTSLQPQEGAESVRGQDHSSCGDDVSSRTDNVLA